MAESSSRWTFDVFLSFRGEDTRWGFISNLYRELEVKQSFKIFKDDQELQIGATISTELFTAIEQSCLAIVVFSPNYASSTWCLDELAKIIESMGTRDKRIMPVFFHVDPSDVRHQRSSFAKAFAEHEVRFRNDTEKVKRWRAALRKVADLTGCISKDYKCERELVEVIVKRVREKLHTSSTITLSNSMEKLVGISSALRQMGVLLAPEAKDVRFIGIWGTSGVGKTTVAKLVLERTAHRFEVTEFVVDGTIVNLQRQLLSRILKETTSQVWNEQEGTIIITKFLSNKKVLLVVDDVDCCDLIKTLARHKSWFGEGSRMIVVTRDQSVLIDNDINISFELVGLTESKALDLFYQNAFKNDRPDEGFLELSKCFVDYTHGLPLALKVLGGFLYNKDVAAWETALESLMRIPNPTIFQKLKLSYDALNDLQKNIFLDIASFSYLQGMERGRVIEQLECHGSNVLIVIEDLIENSLLTIDHNNNVGMHCLVQEMAREIVGEDSRECPSEQSMPGLRSRSYHQNECPSEQSMPGLRSRSYHRNECPSEQSMTVQFEKETGPRNFSYTRSPLATSVFHGERKLRKKVFDTVYKVGTIAWKNFGGALGLPSLRRRLFRHHNENSLEKRMICHLINVHKKTGPRKISYRELALATSNFDEEYMLGQGGFGKVYKCVINDLKFDVAVKKMSPGSLQGLEGCMTEIEICSVLRHRHVVQLIGWCNENGEFLLVYKYMPNGSLDTYLLRQTRILLSWEHRYRIVKELASVLFYLHEQCGVLHRDIKSSNIMLDFDFTATLGDFGLARFLDHGRPMKITGLAGTPGYMAPEYFLTGMSTKKTDVFSFGIVALEIACGKRAEQNIGKWVWELYGEGRILQAADPKLISTHFSEEQMRRLMVVGLWCATPDYKNRPSIEEAIEVLNFSAELPLLPQHRPLFVYP